MFVRMWCHNLDGILHVLDIIRFRPMPAGLVGAGHPWVTGLHPRDGQTIWWKNVLFRSREARPSGRGPPRAGGRRGDRSARRALHGEPGGQVGARPRDSVGTRIAGCRTGSTTCTAPSIPPRASSSSTTSRTRSITSPIRCSAAKSAGSRAKSAARFCCCSGTATTTPPSSRSSSRSSGSRCRGSRTRTVRASTCCGAIPRPTLSSISSRATGRPTPIGSRRCRTRSISCATTIPAGRYFQHASLPGFPRPRALAGKAAGGLHLLPHPRARRAGRPVLRRSAQARDDERPGPARRSTDCFGVSARRRSPWAGSRRQRPRRLLSAPR